MAITVPYAISLKTHDDAKDVVVTGDSSGVADSMKIFIGGNATPGKVQSIVGSLRSCYRLMLSGSKANSSSADRVAYGQWDDAVAGNITLATASTNVTDDHVAVVMASGFISEGQSHFVDETFKQLINVLLEKTADN